MVNAYHSYGTLKTPQSEPIPGSAQQPNAAGGYAFAVDDWTRLERFLVLGSEGGTYYIGEHELTRQNAQAVERCIKADPERTLAAIHDVSVSGRAAKNEPALFALAMFFGLAPANFKMLASRELLHVARTGTHLLHFVAYAEQFRGWGRTLKRAVQNWYLSKSPADLAYQLVKYQSRDKWTQRDLLRLAHPKAEGALNDVLHWAVKGWDNIGPEPPSGDTGLGVLWAYEKAKTLDEPALLDLIRGWRLPREALPTEALNSEGVWQALLDEPMPVTALVRNLATMTRVGLLGDFRPATGQVIARLMDNEAMARGRVHPIQLLTALRTYEAGKGERGHHTWTPVRAVVDALDAAFYASFSSVQPTGKRWMIGLDVSGSMKSTTLNGLPYLSCHEAQAAMALVIASTEQQYAVCPFDTLAYPLTISPRQRLDDVLKAVTSLGGGGTNCAIPIQVATEKNLPVDVFVIFTDSETWQGDIHPVQALQQYRKQSGIPAKLVVVAMASIKSSIADPGDAGMLNVVGFDARAPQIITDFARN